MRGKSAFFATLFVGAFTLSGCGGGGGASSSAMPGGLSQAGSGSPTQAPSASAAGTAHFTISDPYSTSQSVQRKPEYFSPATSAIRITVNGTPVQLALSPKSPNCTVANSNIACAVDVAVNNGPLTYDVQTLGYDNAVLSKASGTATINGTTTIPLALQGVWKIATVHFANEHPLMGSPAIIAVQVSAYDADGQLIIGPEPYSFPITLQNSDTSGATTLSTTSVKSPCECVTLTYDGKSYVNAVVTPILPDGNPGNGDTLVPSLNVNEYAIPSGSVAATNGGHGRMIVNADDSITFIEQNSHIGHVTMAGVVTETTVQHDYADIVKRPDGTLWGVTGSTIERINSDGSATQVAQLPAYHEGSLSVGSDGNVWAPIGTNIGAAVSRVTPTGDMKTFAAANVQTLDDAVFAGDGNIWYGAEKYYGAAEFVRLTPDGQFTEFPFPNPDCCSHVGNVALGPDGQIYSINGAQLIERVTTGGTVSYLADGSVPPMDFYGMSTPNALGFGPDGALWISDGNASCDPVVERITTTGSYARVELPIACDSFYGPLEPVTAFIAGPDGNLWYARDKFVGKIVLR